MLLREAAGTVPVPAPPDADMRPPDSHSVRSRKTTVSCRSCCRPFACLPSAFIGNAIVVGPCSEADAVLACFGSGPVAARRTIPTDGGGTHGADHGPVRRLA
uniref:Uncharacterized protein n=1 Tax=Anopheles farauti TaxID=69004 RepID=A0A182QXR9_9DIPT